MVWGSLLAIFGLTKLLAGDDQALGNKIFGSGNSNLALWDSLLSWQVKPAIETKDNVVNFTYLGGLVIAGIVVLGVLSLFLPSSCTSNDSNEPTDLYYRK